MVFSKKKEKSTVFKTPGVPKGRGRGGKTQTKGRRTKEGLIRIGKKNGVGSCLCLCPQVDVRAP